MISSTTIHRHTKTLLQSMLVMVNFMFALSASATSVFINELHYDNNGSDIDEGIEIAGPHNTDLSGWSLVLYNATGGVSYSTIYLGGIIPDQSNGFGTLFFAAASMQNGPADGIALIDNTSFVRQFISYEGVLTATDGPASGLSSEDIGIAEATDTALGLSLQLTGSGQDSTDFVWQPGPQSYNAINSGQSFTANTSPVPLPATLPLLSSALLSLIASCRSRCKAAAATAADAGVA